MSSPIAAARGGGGHSGGYRSSATRSSTRLRVLYPSVHVRGYTTRRRASVYPYTRSYPRPHALYNAGYLTTRSRTYPSIRPVRSRYRTVHTRVGSWVNKYDRAGHAARTNSDRINRSEAAKRQFEAMSGHPRGWPGHVVDHVIPLACGGADAPSNMQWQTVADGKAKDKWERKGCHGGHR